MNALERARAKKEEMACAKSALSALSPDVAASKSGDGCAKSALSALSPQAEAIRSLYPAIKDAVAHRYHMRKASTDDVKAVRHALAQHVDEVTALRIARAAGPAVMAWALIDEYRDGIEALKAQGYDVFDMDAALRLCLRSSIGEATRAGGAA